MTGPLPDDLTQAPQTTARQRPKGSDHDHSRDTQDSRPTDNGEPSEATTSRMDGADGPDDGDPPDTDRQGYRGERTAVREAERPADSSGPSNPDYPSVRLTAGRDGALWVVVDGVDVDDVAARISAVCDSLIQGRRLRK